MYVQPYYNTYKLHVHVHACTVLLDYKNAPLYIAAVASVIMSQILRRSCYHEPQHLEDQLAVVFRSDAPLNIQLSIQWQNQVHYQSPMKCDSKLEVNNSMMVYFMKSFCHVVIPALLHVCEYIQLMPEKSIVE